MKAGELKNCIDNSRIITGTELVSYLNKYQQYIADNGFSTCCLATLFFCIDGSYKLVDFNSVSLLLKKEKENSYQLMGLPLHSDLNKVKDIVNLCIELGIGLDLSEYDLFKLKLNVSPDVYMDNYLYSIDTMNEYLSNCSRSTRKNINRFDKEYFYEVFESKSVPDEIKDRIKTINEIWLKEFKDSSPLYEHMINNTTMCLDSHLIGLIKSAVIVYRDKENNIVAYDYIEVWGDTVYALGGKSIIKDISSFKPVNRNVMHISNKMFGATKMEIGYSNIFSAKSKKPMEHAIHLSEAKSSFPNVKTMYSMFLPSTGKYKKAITVDNSSNSLF